LKKPLNQTYWRFLIGGLAISGIIPFAGFFSKDRILGAAFISHPGGKVVWAIGLITALMTAYYTFRIIFKTFLSPPADAHAVEHAHESPRVMMIPLTILALLSIVGGFVGFPGSDWIGKFLAPVFPATHAEMNTTTEMILGAVALIFGAAGIYIAYLVHMKKPEVAEKFASEHPVTSAIHKELQNKYYVDEIYDAVFVKPIRFVSEKIFYRIFDVEIIDAVVNDVAKLLRSAGGVFRWFQTGDARSYAAAILIGTLGLIAYFLWMVR
jgi:NADH-quinone oxidoreductase subunit L